MTNWLSATEEINLTNCDREPIHIPDAIQSHGVLMVLTEPDLRIAQISENAHEILGIEASALLDRPIGEFIGGDCLQLINGCLDRNFEYINPLPICFFFLGDCDELNFNGLVHRALSGELVLELEPKTDNEKNEFFHFYHQIKHTLTKIQQAESLTDLCNLIVQEVQQITGFDRVMVYRFSSQGDGMVFAEAKQPEQEAFLGLRYPDSDIPKQSKHLYTLNWLRLIPDVHYQAVGLVTHQGQKNSQKSAPTKLDMSYCGLRSISPFHIEYLKNMGVNASMSISLMQNRKLWGLIACHHNTSKFIPYEIRTICEFLGQLMSTEIANKEANENLDYKLHLKDIQRQFLERLTQTNNFIKELVANPKLLLNLTSAQGAAICQDDQIFLIGQTPNEDAVISLIDWLNGSDRPNLKQTNLKQTGSKHHFQQHLFITNALPSLYPEFAKYQNIACGLMAMEISKFQRQYLLWFRPEISQTVTWAGNPEKQKQIAEDGTVMFSPRHSFEAWQEFVYGKSSEWLDCEVSSAIELRQAIVDIVLRQADELANVNLSLERSNNELDAFAYIASHDLKEPLRGIHNYASFLLEDYSDKLNEAGTDKLHTLVRLTKRMESLIESLLQFSRLGRQDLHMNQIDLNLLLHNTSDLFKMNPQWQNCTINIPQALPMVWGDSGLIEEIFMNLISNAFKYSDHPQKIVEIGCIDGSEAIAQADGHATLYVRDNGIGIREKHLDSIFRIFKRLHPANKYGGGSGAGLTIVKKIVDRHGGKIQVQSKYGQGTPFKFTLPVRKPTMRDE
jgi:light-regulated signal transduction histidine kinase (bacteriophytochrome)